LACSSPTRSSGTTPETTGLIRRAATLELKTAWHDGTRELLFEPLEFLERLVMRGKTFRP
jgi:hypothetical protein